MFLVSKLFSKVKLAKISYVGFCSEQHDILPKTIENLESLRPALDFALNKAHVSAILTKTPGNQVKQTDVVKRRREHRKTPYPASVLLLTHEQVQLRNFSDANILRKIPEGYVLVNVQ